MGVAKKPNAAVSVNDQSRIQDLYERVRAADAKLVGPDGKAKLLPSSLYIFLSQLLDDLNAGKSMTILQHDASLTTVEAAKLLGISRQFLIRLLEQNSLPFHLVGTHRRLYARDVLAYKSRRDANRRKVLDDLAMSESKEGIYDRFPVNDVNTQ